MKKIIINLVLVIFLLCPMIVDAETVSVTKENLTTALENLKTWTNTQTDEDDDDETDDILSPIKSYAISDDTIEIENVNGKYSFTYIIQSDGKVLFKNSQKFTNNMSYADYQNQEKELSAVLIGYMLIANIEGASFDDAGLYYAFSCLDNFELLQTKLNDIPFVVMELNTDPNVSVELETETMEINGKQIPVIKSEDFSSRSLEYALAYYSKPISYNDNKESYLNSFEYKLASSEKTETYITVDSTLIVDSTKDYTQLKSISEKLTNDFGNSLEGIFDGSNESLIEQGTQTDNKEENTPVQVQQPKKDEFENPQTGNYISIACIILGSLISLIIVFLTKKNRLYNV